MMSAFYQDAHWRLNWPGMTLEQIIDGCARRLPRNLVTGRDRKRHEVVVEMETGEVVGYARWVLSPRLQRLGQESGTSVFWPAAQIVEPTAVQREEFERLWESATEEGRGIGSNSEMVTCLSVQLDAEDERIKADDEWLELEYLTTSPRHQNRGIATMLVQSGLAQADAHRTNVLVMASTDRGNKLYERCGFEHVSTIVQDDSAWGGSLTGSRNSWYLRRIRP